MDKIQFIQATTRLRVLETRLLDRIKLDRMIDSPSSENALKILQDSNYGSGVNVQKPQEFESLLGEELKQLYSLMYEICPLKELVDMLAVRYDYHNIKVLLKAKALDKDFDNLLASVQTVPVTKIKEYLEGEKVELPAAMKEAIDRARDVYSKDQDPQQIDIMMDRYMYQDILERAKLIGDPYAIDYFKTVIDFNNIKTFLRVRKQNKSRPFLMEALLDGGFIDKNDIIPLSEEPLEQLANKMPGKRYDDLFSKGVDEFRVQGNITGLERQMENYLMNYIKKGKYVTFGIEPLFSFLFAKETEIKNVRIIMVGKINNIASSLIRERLREIYV